MSTIRIGARTGLLVVDLQERFVPAIPRFEGVAQRAALLVQGWRLFRQPVICTEQNPAGLGPTVATVASHLETGAPVAKTSFSCCGEEAVRSLLQHHRCEQMVVCGIETHVCILQTALDLLDRGCAVFVAVDAVASRRDSDHDTALRRMVQAGVVPTTAESALLELTGDARHGAFRQVRALIR